MNTKEYVTKYKLNVSNQFNHNEFVADLTNDFITLLEVGNSTKHFKGYENAVRAIRMKWDAINNKTVNCLPDKLWNYFYATVIAKTKEELFPEQVAKQKEINEQKKREWEERKKWREREDSFFWSFLFLDGLMRSRVPSDSYAVLGLNTNATSEEVTKKYRELSIKHHPDKGGNKETFIQITEAKNKILAYLQK